MTKKSRDEKKSSQYVKWLNRGIFLLMTAIGVLFVINIIVIGDTGAAIRMHGDLSPAADSVFVTGKVLICFITGILYLAASYGIFRQHYSFMLAGVAGSILFVGYYLLELVLWGSTHPMVWFGFATFGIAAIVIGVYYWVQWTKRQAQQDEER